MLRTWILLLAITGTCSSGDLDGDERCDSLPQQGRGTLHGVACLQAKQKGWVKNLEEEQLSQINLQAKLKGWDQNLEEDKPSRMNLQAKRRGGIKNLEEEQPSQMNLQAKRKGVVKNLEDEALNQMAFGTCDPPAETQLHPMVSDSDAQKFMFTSVLHTIVGDDGVVILSLERDPGRYRSAVSHFIQVGIKPMSLAATDGHCASDSSLNKGCRRHDDMDGLAGLCRTGEKVGIGCVSRSEQAICDSHKRALEFAKNRGNEWTLIMEDDAIPVVPDGVDWDTSLKEAWAKVPSDARIVRLAWCRFDDDPDDLPGDEIVLVGDFKFTRGREQNLGGCPIATLYHKSIIPEYLKIFPCCAAVDSCSAWDFYLRRQAVSADNPEGKRYVDRVLWNLQVIDSPRVIRTLQDGSMYGRHFGIMMPSGQPSHRDFNE